MIRPLARCPLAPRRPARARALATPGLAAGLALLAAAAGAAPPPEVAVPPAPAEPGAVAPIEDAAALDARIFEIEAAIARDEAALEAWVSADAAGGAEEFARTPELREIAGRLPRLQSELRALRARRAALDAP